MTSAPTRNQSHPRSSAQQTAAAPVPHGGCPVAVQTHWQLALLSVAPSGQAGLTHARPQAAVPSGQVHRRVWGSHRPEAHCSLRIQVAPAGRRAVVSRPRSSQPDQRGGSTGRSAQEALEHPPAGRLVGQGPGQRVEAGRHPCGSSFGSRRAAPPAAPPSAYLSGQRRTSGRLPISAARAPYV